jgi:phosphohistidine phosphatase
MAKRPDSWFLQSGVIPYRRKGEEVDVLLVTSRSKKRWVIPKGIVEPGMTAAASAANEALEEAGVLGEALVGPIGRYEYEKWGGTCRVDVFAMETTRVLDVWEEDHREREWVSIAEAQARVREPALKAILVALPGTLATAPR